MKRQCQTCGAAFEGRPNRLYCSTKCRREAEFEKRRAAGPVVTGDAGADFWENWPDLKFPDISFEDLDDLHVFCFIDKGVNDRLTSLAKNQGKTISECLEFLIDEYERDRGR